MSSQVQTTLRALSVVYPAMILILAYEMSTKLYKTPFITAVAKSYGHETAPLVTGTVAAANYLLQLITAPIWGRIADAGYPRLTLGAAILAPLVPSVAILFGPSTSDSRPVIVLFNVSTVLSGIFGSPLAVAFNLSKTLLKLKKVTSPVITARAMLLVMSCVPLGVLSGIGITELLKQLLGHQDTFQKTIFSLSLTSIAIVSFMALLM
jgi:MFS family permease